MASALLELRPEGLYCPAGDFHIDPVRPVPRAVLTHAHADHARPGSRRYWAAHQSAALLRQRLGSTIDLEPLDYGQAVHFGPVRVSLHPAGHILGSAQVRVEHEGAVWVVTGDFKREADPTCTPFEPLRCDTLICEATFALPVYRWPPLDQVIAEIRQWWRDCAARRRPALLFCYALGKAQRLLAELARAGDETVYLHGAMQPLVELYRQHGIRMLPTEPVAEQPRGHDYAGCLILAPPSAAGSPWMRRFHGASTAFASGWMQLRGNRRRRGHDRGFVLSDHADWPGLLRTIAESGARRVLATHGQTEVLVRHLREQGLEAAELGMTREALDDG